MGITSAYYIRKYDPTAEITVIDKDPEVRGASEGNACQAIINPFVINTGISIKKVLKENILRYDNPMSYFKLSLIFDLQFMYFVKTLFKYVFV